MDKEQGKILVGELNTEIGQSLVRWNQDYGNIGKQSPFLNSFFAQCARDEVEARVGVFSDEYPEIVITHMSWVEVPGGGYTVNTDWGLNTNNEE